MASLIKSAAVPWIGALIAFRSAALRTVLFDELMSRMYRRRPSSVST